MKIKRKLIALLSAGMFALQVGGCPLTDLFGGILGG